LYGHDGEHLITRPKELYDGAMPSGNSLMAWNLVRLYHLNDGNNNIANKLAKAFAAEQSFNQTGTLTKMTTTLADYASTFVGTIASQTSSSLSGYEYQSELVNSISNKQAEISGVDSDQELAHLIIYQQSYSACAQVWSATRELVDILFNAL